MTRSELVLGGLGALATLSAAAILSTTWDAVTFGHPAYLVLLIVVELAGLVLFFGRAARMRVVALVVVAVLTAGVVGSTIWLRPQTASPAAMALTRGAPGVDVAATRSTITLTPQGAKPAAGLIFQPGAKVDARAYLPLLTQVAAAGYLVVIVQQPLDIGFLATGAPAAVLRAHPEITHWALGGHSLGGVAAAEFVRTSAPGSVRGLLFWASYPNGSMAERTDLVVTSVSGTNDGLATPAKVDQSRPDLPPATHWVAVAGGIHSYFGDYGMQSGDGQPAISREAAQAQIVAATLALLAEVAA